MARPAPSEAGTPLLDHLRALDAVARETRDDPEALSGWLAGHARHLGFQDVAVHRPAPGVPYVFGHLPGAGGRTALVYGHLDVAGPRGRRVVAGPDGWLRGPGVSDDRGRLVAVLDGVRASMRAGVPPCSVVLLADPEEERGSPHAGAALDAFTTWWDRGGPDRRVGWPLVAIVADSTGTPDGGPAVVVGARGLVDAEIRVAGASIAPHSGRTGGAAPGPAEVLARVVAGLHDEAGRVALEGFYDDVRDPGPAARAAASAYLPDETSLARRLGRPVGDWGEPGWSAAERTVLRPALTVDALVTGGPDGPSSGAAVVPSCASARVRVRMVPDQRAAAVVAALRQRVQHVTPRGADVQVRLRSVSPPVDVPPHHPAVEALSAACRHVWGVSPGLVRTGGSLPVAARLQARGTTPLLLGVGDPDDGAHGPHERVRASVLDGLAATVARTLVELGR